MRPALPVAALLAAALGCGSSNEILVTVHSDLELPVDINRLTLRAQSGNWQRELARPLGVAPALKLPATLSLVADARDARFPVRIDVWAALDEAPVVSRAVALPFWPSGRQELEIHLDKECALIECRDGATCVPGWGCHDPRVVGGQPVGGPPDECDCNSPFPVCVGSVWTYRVVDIRRNVPAFKDLVIGDLSRIEDPGNAHGKDGVPAYVHVRTAAADRRRRWFTREGTTVVWQKDENFDQRWKPTTTKYYIPFKYRFDGSLLAPGDGPRRLDFVEVEYPVGMPRVEKPRTEIWTAVPPPPRYPAYYPPPICQRKETIPEQPIQIFCWVPRIGKTYEITEGVEEELLVEHRVRGCGQGTWPPPGQAAPDTPPPAPPDAAVDATAPPTPDAPPAPAPEPVPPPAPAPPPDTRPPDRFVERVVDPPPDAGVDAPADEPPVVQGLGDPPPDAAPADAPPGVWWVDRTPVPRPRAWPAARECAAMAYDAGRSRVVMYGGVSSSGLPLRDLWEWDGARGEWTNRTPTPFPSSWPLVEGCSRAVYDSLRHRVLVSSGASLWSWDGGAGNWTKVRLAGGEAPAGRVALGYDLAYDEQRDRVVAAWKDSHLLHIWELDLLEDRWLVATPCGAPVFSGNAMWLAYGGAGRTFLLADGTIAEWDGEQWSIRTEVLGTRAETIAFDPSRRVLWTLTPGVRPQAWSFETRQWSDWSIYGASAPPDRIVTSAAFDGARRRLVLFGGKKDRGETLDDLWEVALPPPLPGKGGTDASVSRAGDAGAADQPSRDAGAAPSPGAWHARTPSPLPREWPPPRACAGAAYDEARAKLLLVGGKDGDRKLQDLWEWDAATGVWTTRAPSAPGAWPSFDSCPLVTFDSVRKELLMVTRATSDVLSEVWEWTPSTGQWLQRTVSRSPPEDGQAAIEPHHVAFDATRGELLAVGRTRDSGGGGWETWAWSPWTGFWSRRAAQSSLLSDGREVRSTALVTPPAGPPLLLARYDAKQCPGSPSVVLWRWTAGEWVLQSAHRRVWAGPPAVYDRARGSLLALGDEDAVGRHVWEWVGGGDNRWIDRSPASGHPLLRREASVVYDAVRRKVLLFGGEIESPRQSLADLWELELPP